MKMILPFLSASLASSSALSPRALIVPEIKIPNQHTLTLGCDPISQTPVHWPSCYDAWEKMHHELPASTEHNLHFLGRHIRPFGPAGTMWLWES